MKAGRPVAGIVGLSLLFLAFAPAVQAEDVEKKWRLSFGVGGFNTADEIESPSANELVLVDECLRTLTCAPGTDVVTHFFRDPRNDSGAFGTLGIEPARVGTLAVQYALTKIYIIEASVGYQTADVGDADVSAQLLGDHSDLDEVIFNFQSYKVNVGKLERVPLQLSFLVRMRPRASFNPYFGAGIGYSFIGFEVDPAFSELSRTLDSSRGTQLRLTNSISAPPSLTDDGLPASPRGGATVSATDTFEWHLAAGFEMTFKAKWSFFTDLRWVDASRSLEIGIDNKGELGLSVPNLVSYKGTAYEFQRYGPVEIGSCDKVNGCTPEGLIDVGRAILVPIDTADPDHDCQFGTNDPECELDFEYIQGGDGAPDPGAYYLQGGKVQYDGFSLLLGVRYTF